MAQPDIIRGTYFVIGIGDGLTPETFTALCGINTRTFRHTHNTQDQQTRDCDAPEDVPVVNRVVTAETWTLTGSGLLNRSNFAAIQALDDGNPHNFRFYWTEPATNHVYQGYYQGRGIITSLELTGNDADFGAISITIDSDGPWTWTTVTPV